MIQPESETARPQPDSEASEAEKAALQQRIGELELRIGELETELTRTRAGRREPVDWRKLLGPALLLVATLLLAVIPSALVIQDRWLRDATAIHFFQNAWCRIKPLCGLAYPSYFLLVFAGFLGIIVLVILQRAVPLRGAGSSPAGAPPERDKVRSAQARIALALLLVSVAGLIAAGARAVILHTAPGWELAAAFLVYLLGWILREAPLGRMAIGWRRDGGRWVAIGLVFCALVAALTSGYATPQFQWAFAVLLILTGLNLARYWRGVSPVVWVVALAMILYAFNTNAWWLSGIGDEYAFFYQARYIAENESLAQLGAHLFNGQAVYGAHPYLSSVIQACFMKLLGVNGFAWRFSNAFLCAAAVGFCYLFFRTFVRERTALFAALLLAVSHYVMSFGKIGYNNLQALFAMSLTLAAAAWVVRTIRPLAFVLLGAAMGFCFYVYPAALYVLPIPLLLLLFYRPPTTKAAIGGWLLMIASALILVFPLLLQPEYWKIKVAGTFFYSPQLVQTTGNLLVHLARNFLYAFFSFLYTPEEGHFIAVGYVDPLTAALVAIGCAAVLKRLPRERFAWFLLTSFVALLFLVGASHDRLYPPDTRMFLLLPWFALFAAIGLAWIGERIAGLGLFRVRAAGFVILIMVIALGLNMYQAYPLARDRMAGFQSLETLFFRLVQRAQRDDQVLAPKTYVFITDPSWSSIGIRQLPLIYPVQAQFAEVVIKEPNVPEANKATLADPNALVIIKPWLDPAWLKALDPPLRALGKVPCPIKTTTGDTRFTLWHAPGLEWLCQ
ncbi:MAG: glycosyltransferase family 39 protein [Chloroflexi bacterium]|nr:glycosyltransferase family 39 protein [Chloroflexota bacterium]